MPRSLIGKFIGKLIPQQEFAGFEVGDKVIRFLLLSHYDLSVMSAIEVPLVPGIVEKGELKKQSDFIVALETLKSKITVTDKSNIPCVVTAPSSLFFFQVIELPEIADASYDEAVRLNASQTSPLQLNDAYLDWQNLGVNLKTLQREFLVGIVGHNRVDPYLEAFQRAGFEIIALESRSLSILRLFSYFSKTIEKNITILFVDVGQDGMSFIIGRQGKLYFDFFLYWSEISEAADGTITKEDLEAILKREVLRMVEFTNLHYSEGISHFVLFSPVLKPDLTAFIQSQFSLKPVEMTPPPLGALSADLWAGTIGAGLRGSLIPRETDDLISLLPEGTEVVYQEKRLGSFISLWSKIVSFTLMGMIMVFGVVWSVALRQQKNHQNTLGSINALPEVAEVKSLQADARVFNEQLLKLDQVEKKTVRWSEFLDPIVNAAATYGVSVERLSLGQGNQEIRLQGTAPSEQGAFDFSAAVEKYTIKFSKVSLPLSSLVPVPGGVLFDMVITMAKVLK